MGGTSGSSVSSIDGIPVTKSISCGFQTLVRLVNFQPKYSRMKNGMLTSAAGARSRGEYHGYICANMSRDVQAAKKSDALNFQKTVNPLMKMKMISQNVAQYDSHGCRLV